MKEIGINPIARSVLFAKLIDDIENGFIEYIKNLYEINVFDVPTEDEVDCGVEE